MKPINHGGDFWEIRTPTDYYHLYPSGTFLAVDGNVETPLARVEHWGPLHHFEHYQLATDQILGSYLFLWINQRVLRYSTTSNAWCDWNPALDPWDELL